MLGPIYNPFKRITVMRMIEELPNRHRRDATGSNLRAPGLLRWLAVPSILAVALLLAPPLASSRPHKDATPQTRADLAGKAYAAALVDLQVGRSDSERIYTWSVRWLDSELAAASSKKAKKQAFTAHRQRMRDLRNQLVSMIGTGMMAASAEHAANYFAAEADAWQQSQRKTPVN